MVHIIWDGKGYLVAVVTFGFSLVANLITNHATGSKAYWEANKWPFAVSLFFSAVVCWFVGQGYRNRDARHLMDPETGEEFVFRETHSLFFIPILWWGPLLAIGGVVALCMDLAK